MEKYTTALAHADLNRVKTVAATKDYEVAHEIADTMYRKFVDSCVGMHYKTFNEVRLVGAIVQSANEGLFERWYG